MSGRPEEPAELLRHKREPEVRKREVDIRSAIPAEPEEPEPDTEAGMLGEDATRRKRVRKPRKPRTKTENE